MKRLAALFLALIACVAQADVTFPITFVSNSASGITGLVGDCTASGTGSVTITCTKTNNVSFGSLATLNTSSAVTWTAQAIWSLSGQTANTDVVSSIDQNATAATLGNQQYDCHEWDANVWGTTLGTSQKDVWIACSEPVQAATPTGLLVFYHKVGAGSFTKAMALTGTGQLSLAANLASLTGTSVAFFGSYNNPTGTGGINFVGGSTGPLALESQSVVVELYGGTPVTVSGCGTAGSITGHGTSGTFIVGTGAVTCTFVININGATGLTALHGWNGKLIDSTAGIDCLQTTAVSTTTATFLCNSVVTTGDLMRVVHLDPY